MRVRSMRGHERRYRWLYLCGFGCVSERVNEMVFRGQGICKKIQKGIERRGGGWFKLDEHSFGPRLIESYVIRGGRKFGVRKLERAL